MLGLLLSLLSAAVPVHARASSDWDALRERCEGGASPLRFRIDCREERLVWRVTREGRPSGPPAAANQRRIGFAVASIVDVLPFTYRPAPIDGMPLACAYEELKVQRDTSLDLGCVEALELSADQLLDLCRDELERQAGLDPAAASVGHTGRFIELCPPLP